MNLRNILMVVSLLISVVIGAALARGGKLTPTGGAGTSGRPLIGFSMDTLKEQRWQGDKDLFTAEVEKLGCDVKVESANSDDNQQIKDVQSLLTDGVKVLVIVPHDGLAMARAVNMAHQAGVPVIAYDRLIKKCDLDMYIAFDAVQVGVSQATFLVQHLPTPGKGNIVIIYGAPTDNNAHLLGQGFDEVLDPLEKRGDIKVVFKDWAEDWKPENAKKIAQAAITNGQHFDAILASNDGTAGGAIQALTEAGLAGKVLVTGQDAELAACQRIASGTQTMTIYKPLHLEAQGAADAAVKLATNKPVVAKDVVNNDQVDVPSVLYPVTIVTKDNLMSTVIKDNFRSYDDVYQGIPDNQRPPKSAQVPVPVKVSVATIAARS
jgi:D-xylose transport system substrate-binding protein